jgi:hypothetical protein
MSEQRVLFLRKGFIGTCAFAALVLLASFYSIVSGAVDRAARQRVAGSGEVRARRRSPRRRASRARERVVRRRRQLTFRRFAAARPRRHPDNRRGPRPRQRVSRGRSGCNS